MLKPRSRRDHAHSPNLSVLVHRSSGGKTWATMTRIWYDGCEISSKEAFEAEHGAEDGLPEQFEQLDELLQTLGTDARSGSLGVLHR